MGWKCFGDESQPASQSRMEKMGEGHHNAQMSIAVDKQLARIGLELRILVVVVGDV